MRRCLLIAALVGGAAAPGFADGPTPLRQAAISAGLYARGLEAGDPLLILAAAQLRKALDMQPLGGEALPGAPGPAGWEAMIEDALALTAADDPLRDLAEDIAAQAWKGVISGPVYRIEALGAGDEARLANLSFRGGDYAEVYAEAAPGTDLNLSILDDQGRLVCADSHPSHVAYCGWTPAEDGHFTLVVENRGTSETHYALMTN